MNRTWGSAARFFALICAMLASTYTLAIPAYDREDPFGEGRETFKKRVVLDQLVRDYDQNRATLRQLYSALEDYVRDAERNEANLNRMYGLKNLIFSRMLQSGEAWATEAVLRWMMNECISDVQAFTWPDDTPSPHMSAWPDEVRAFGLFSAIVATASKSPTLVPNVSGVEYSVCADLVDLALMRAGAKPWDARALDRALVNSPFGFVRNWAASEMYRYGDRESLDALRVALNDTYVTRATHKPTARLVKQAIEKIAAREGVDPTPYLVPATWTPQAWSKGATGAKQSIPTPSTATIQRTPTKTPGLPHDAPTKPAPPVPEPEGPDVPATIALVVIALALAGGGLWFVLRKPK